MWGGGRTGSNLAKRLSGTGHDSVVVEKDENRAHELAAELDALVINGSGSDIEVLKEAGAEKADALAALAPDDEVNFMACKLAKELKIPRVVARVNESRHVGMFEDVGADVAISPINATIGLFEKAITGPQIYGLLSLGGQIADAIEVSVGKDSAASGQRIQEINLPDLVTIATITRGGELIPPRGRTVLQEGDRIILAGDPDQVISVGNMLKGK